MRMLNTFLNLVNSLTTGSDPLLKTVMYADNFDANIRIDRKPTPAAVTYLLSGFEVDAETGMRKDRVDVEVFVFNRCDFAAKGESVKTVMESVEPAVDEIISLVMDERSWTVEGKIKATTAYGRFDTNVCGYSLQFTLVDRQGTCI